jgi:hypothetical protein
MGYLLSKLFWYVLVALVLGLVVGWVTCTARDDSEA